MKKWAVLSILLTSLLFCTQSGISPGEIPLTEDLWGNPIRLAEYLNSKSPTVIVPFSTSNCGYCLIDGYYTELNYLTNNTRAGGGSFHMDLFNPQADVYTFQKHFGWTFPILTYPPSLHRLHRDGFPTVLSFRQGDQKTCLFHNYDRVDSLGRLLGWKQARQYPSGSYQMATRLIFENFHFDAVWVYPAGSQIPPRRLEQQKKWKSFSAKNLDRLTEADLKKHLFLQGDFSFREIADFLRNQDIPFRFVNHQIRIGSYAFDYDSTGFHVVCPNPFNPSKVLVIQVQHGQQIPKPSHYLDYLFYRTTPDSTIRLLYGHFDKSDPFHWKFSEGRAFSEMNKTQLCAGKCEIPQTPPPPPRETAPIRVTHRRSPHGELYTLGSKNCRLPDLLADPSGNIWISWEEDGDIHLAEIATDGRIVTRKIENDRSDSYFPRLAVADGKIWIFYLNNREHYYWLYARQFDGLRLSEALLVSPREPYDVVTPAAASDPANGDLAVAWSAWMANLRLPFYRRISHNIFSKIKEIPLYSAIYEKNYRNAWWPSLCYGPDGALRAVWNQHYPAICGVFGGTLPNPPQPITRSAKKMEDWEIGGYPSLFTDGKKNYVVWEGDAWNTWQGKSQPIKFSVYDAAQRHWSIGEVISLPEQTLLNQTPTGTATGEGTIWVVYSGRPRGNNSHWGIYLTFRQEKRWSAPVLISGETSARHPRIVADRQNNLWISWHQGVGTAMTIGLLKLDRQTIGLN